MLLVNRCILQLPFVAVHCRPIHVYRRCQPGCVATADNNVLLSSRPIYVCRYYEYVYSPVNGSRQQTNTLN